MKRNEVKVSVILPTYNRADIIPRAIKTVLRQTMPDFELFVIDDASTDNTESVVRSFEDPRIRYIKRTVNHLELYHETGESDNPRNDGLKQAVGQYIAYLDSDDMYRTDFLEVMSEFMDEHPDVGLAYCDAIWHRHLEGEPEMANCNLSVAFGPKIMTIRNIIRTLTVMHRREVIRQVGFFKPIWVKVPHPGVPYVGIEDWDYWFRTSKKFKVKHHPIILGHKINKTSDYYDDPEFDPEFKDGEAGRLAAVENLDVFHRIRMADEFQRLSEWFEPVQGYLRPEEGYALMLLAAHGSGQGEIVEIGSFLGRSTCWLAHGARSAGREKVTAVDHFLGSKEHQAGKGFECDALVKEGTTYNQFIENLRRMKLKGQVRPVRADSVTAAQAWKKLIRLLFIDGDHRYEAAKRDFDTWSGFVIPGGYVVFHDVGSWPGVTRFYRELMRNNDLYQEVARAATLRVIRKKNELNPA